MVELEPVELVFELADCVAVRCHLGVMAAPLLHDLIDDQLGVTLDVKSSDAQLDGDTEPIDESLVFSDIVGCRKMEADHIP